MMMMMMRTLLRGFFHLTSQTKQLSPSLSLRHSQRRRLNGAFLAKSVNASARAADLLQFQLPGSASHHFLLIIPSLQQGSLGEWCDFPLSTCCRRHSLSRDGRITLRTPIKLARSLRPHHECECERCARCQERATIEERGARSQ